MSALQRYWECPYCGTVKPSENHTGSDVACCGERGHAIPYVVRAARHYCGFPHRGDCVCHRLDNEVIP